VIKNYRQNYPDKAKPFVRGGQKVSGLIRKMAELPKDESFSMFGFFVLSRFVNIGCSVKSIQERRSVYENKIL